MPEEGTLSESLSIRRKRWKALRQQFGVIFGQERCGISGIHRDECVADRHGGQQPQGEVRYRHWSRGNSSSYQNPHISRGVARIFQGGVQFAEMLLTTPTF